MTDQAQHETVLRQEAVAALAVQPDGAYIDATFGRGGHSRAILDQLGATGSLLVLDRDPEAITAAAKLQLQDSRLLVAHAAFSRLEEQARTHGFFGRADGILFDLGVSSPQLDRAERGFSFMRSGPLDMRMNPAEGISAAQWINAASERDIADVMFQYGEERHSRRIARRIVMEREIEPFTTTGQLAEIVKQAHPAWEKDKHPATRAFQAIRIYINKEFEELDSGLQQALDTLTVGGRLVVISFHSLEDRIVKKFIVKQTKGDNFPRRLPIAADQLKPRLKSLGKAVRAQASEVSANPRSRSAIMRVAEKIS
jgi:16S rRNA (cytosine1402-N4)-methyltransferase